MSCNKGFLWLILGVGVGRYFTNKVSVEKNREIERKNINIEILERWMTLRDHGIAIERFLKEKNCKRVAIYGMGVIGNHLYEELRGTEIEIIGIDRDDIYNNFQIRIYRPDDDWGQADLIIVTPLDYKSVCKSLASHHGKTISFPQLLGECEKYLYPA